MKPKKSYIQCCKWISNTMIAHRINIRIIFFFFYHYSPLIFFFFFFCLLCMGIIPHRFLMLSQSKSWSLYLTESEKHVKSSPYLHNYYKTNLFTSWFPDHLINMKLPSDSALGALLLFIYLLLLLLLLTFSEVFTFL